jgi:dTDP-4-dehydrorhamnose reductase
MTKILILGVSGMLGSAAYRLFARSEGWQVVGAARSLVSLDQLPRSPNARLVGEFNIHDRDRIIQLLGSEKPDLVLNCIGVIKQLALAKDPLASIEINALFPHRLAQYCSLSNARLIQISTDCVFNGKGHMYRETDFADAEDLYGRTKYLGEVDYPNAVTLRTSIIGHEIGKTISLVDWFLGQPGPMVKGYTHAIYTGLPTVELARVVRDVVAPRPDLHGLWQVASAPIDKFSLLNLIAKAYGKDVTVIPDDSVRIDRSLDGSRFERETGYRIPDWPALVTAMHASRPCS